MIDIGGFTMDYMLLEKGMILWNYTDSTGKGVISMYQRNRYEYSVSKYSAATEPVSR